MMKDKWQRLTRPELAELARKKGIAGYRTLRKEELIAALVRIYKKAQKLKLAKPAPERRRGSTPNAEHTGERRKKDRPRSRPQIAAAHVSTNGTSAEEQIE